MLFYLVSIELADDGTNDGGLLEAGHYSTGLSF